MGQKQDRIYLYAPEKGLSLKGLHSSSAQKVVKNSIVYSKRAPIGYINIVPFDFSTNQGCLSITPYLIDKEFLYLALKNLTPTIQTIARGTTFKEISITNFSNLLIAIPPINEQIKIKDFFILIDSKANLSFQ